MGFSLRKHDAFIANHPEYLCSHASLLQSVGVRVNNFLFGASSPFTPSNGPLVLLLGNLWSLAGKSFGVNFTDGTSTVWAWGVRQGTSIANVTKASSEASTPGIPYRALQQALGVFGNLSVTRRAKSPKVAQQWLPVPNLTYIEDDKGKVYGWFTFYTSSADSIPYGMWKLFDYDLETSVYAKHWKTFVSAARERNVSRLLYDVTGNGGGIVETGYWAVAALYNELAAPDNRYQWLNPVQARVGPSAQNLIDEGFLLNPLTEKDGSGAGSSE
jgi:hypothetical protein